jgi:hypothetical protein
MAHQVMYDVHMYGLKTYAQGLIVIQPPLELMRCVYHKSFSLPTHTQSLENMYMSARQPLRAATDAASNLCCQISTAKLAAIALMVLTSFELGHTIP